MAPQSQLTVQSVTMWIPGGPRPLLEKPWRGAACLPPSTCLSVWPPTTQAGLCPGCQLVRPPDGAMGMGHQSRGGQGRTHVEAEVVSRVPVDTWGLFGTQRW